MPREISQDRLIKDARRLLEHPFWIPELESETLYARRHDDNDGTGLGKIGISFTDNSDAWFSFESNHHGGGLRFRTPFGGGGQSPRVRNALIILALAIKLDNERRPQQEPPPETPRSPQGDYLGDCAGMD